ncbi:hypothetical protein [Candidatus Avelusimicrobium faecicola]|uniref:hypothetical protein n=1 Tax=Candidatus Avelusimicrobium faecicola TaxID=3416205 RepID=UPI003CA28A2C|nr:hypothetical protein [Spirochaetota bacterium]
MIKNKIKCPGFFSWGGAPNPPYFFSLQKKALRAAPCKKLAPQAAPCGPPSAGQIYFYPGILQPFILGAAPLTRLTFFHCKKRPCGPHLAGRTLRAAFAKRLASRAAPCGPPSAGQTYFEPGVLQPFYQGLRPLPALLFSLQKSKQKASTPGSHKIYFYPGILQLPTVRQVKCLYNSVKNKFYRRLQRGALNGNNTAKAMRKKRLILCRSC